MKVLAIILMSCLGFFQAMAETSNIKPGQVYVGKETYNEHPTGRICYVTIRDAQPLPQKGLHCQKIDFQFNSVREDLPKDILTVDSRVTNYHRPEYPQVRTCAMNVNGTTSGDEIYGDETSVLYNQIFGGSHSVGSIRYDYFLTLSPNKKTAVRARIHVLKSLSEYDVDCVNLELM
ncbi:MAG: hypothetical protein OM95_01645 [Bdellovibrio sp. ArHS]|uniref:hypothetical protein n=1 Tax=Bdellovibrio sp. ArHS TaxID=1569284 RepID=UPI000582E31D|nr:hypothetical protein [Bdellovibrio sp. ArHS]KHD89798.1 MAG: hypothetical protein OM95_01645 [Bdellovibrio sp. ArHS]